MARKSGYVESNEAAGAQLSTMHESAELAEAFDFDFGSDGLEEVDTEDLRFAVKVWNMRSKKPGSDDFFRVDEFFDTLTEQTSRKLRCVFMTLHKTNDYSFFDNSKNETVRVCSSYDRSTGRLRVKHPDTGEAEGTERPCEGCSDTKWRKVDGKNVRNCAPVYGVIGLEITPDGSWGAPFMIRFKKTSLNAFKTHMQKHHIDRMKGKDGKPANVPLFAYDVEISLKADEGGLFAVPEITRGERFPREKLQELATQTEHFRDMATDVVKAAEKKESEHQADAIETSGESLRGDDFAD